MSQVAQSTKSVKFIQNEYVNLQSISHNDSEISITCDSFYEVPFLAELPAKRETDKRY